MKTKEEKLASDAWIAATPDDAYDPCPCGCGLKFRFVERNPETYEAHRQKFIKDFIAKMGQK